MPVQILSVKEAAVHIAKMQSDLLMEVRKNDVSENVIALLAKYKFTTVKSFK